MHCFEVEWTTLPAKKTKQTNSTFFVVWHKCVSSVHGSQYSSCCFFSSDEVDDDRLAIVKDLLRSEDTYLENLRNIFDIYMDPLK